MVRKQRWRGVLWVLFGVYLLLLLQVVFYRFTPSALFDPGREPIRDVNLIPFVGMWRDFREVSRTVTRFNLLGNILIFIPLGTFLQLLGRDRRIGVSLAWVLGATLAVETVQLITGFGIFDVDDLILNFLGGLLGVLLYRLFHRLIGAGDRPAPTLAAAGLSFSVPALLLLAIMIL